MKLGAILLTLSLLCVVPSKADVNGGTTCAGCTLIVALIEQLAQVHETDIATAAEKLCDSLPSIAHTACDVFFQAFGPEIINAIYENETPDLACHSLDFCTEDNGQYCHLFPLPKKMRPYRKRPITRVEERSGKGICELPGIKLLCEHIQGLENHLPLQDEDGDKFSEVGTLRGSMWRGKDCDDTQRSFYPGRKPINNDRELDSNCNGIHGIDPDTGLTFEEIYCNKTDSKGVVILGDSAAAHFHIPPDWLRAEKLSLEVFKDLLTTLENEFDWPMLSATTAYTDVQPWENSIDGPSNSLYKYMLEHNRCNHRDYQNIGVNGAKSSSMNDIIKTFARVPSDHPAIVMLSLIGNDVCNGHVDTVARMTTTTDYRKYMMNNLNYLDTALSNGSFVFVSGLADGRVLWELLHDRYHPIGELNKDVTYQQLYNYLNCLEVSPCMGWMNDNATLRDITSERASNLSQVGLNITKTEKFKNFQAIYIDFDIRDVIRRWEEMGGQGWQIIEPVDGFHPNQISQSLTADYIWKNITHDYPHVAGMKNPHNEKIKDVFGDQGGY